MNKKKNLSIPRKEDADASDAVFGSAAEEDAIVGALFLVVKVLEGNIRRDVEEEFP